MLTAGSMQVEFRSKSGADICLAFFQHLESHASPGSEADALGATLGAGEQALTLPHHELDQIQQHREGQQPRPQLHHRRNAAPSRIEYILGIWIEPSTRGRR